MKPFFSRKRLFYVYLILLFAGSVLPFNPNRKTGIPDFEFRLDYVLHLLAFLVLGTLIRIWEQPFKPSASNLSFGLFLCFFLEGIQYFLPYRAFNPWDLFYNLTGLGLGILLAFFYQKVFRRAGDL